MKRSSTKNWTFGDNSAFFVMRMQRNSESRLTKTTLTHTQSPHITAKGECYSTNAMPPVTQRKNCINTHTKIIQLNDGSPVWFDFFGMHHGIFGNIKMAWNTECTIKISKVPKNSSSTTTNAILQGMTQKCARKRHWWPGSLADASWGATKFPHQLSIVMWTMKWQRLYFPVVSEWAGIVPWIKQLESPTAVGKVIC